MTTQTARRRGYGYRGNEGMTPTVTPSVPARTVTCPTCGAAPNEPCHPTDDPNTAAKHAHRLRQRLATRAYNLRVAGGTPDRAYIRTLSPVERRQVRKSAGLTQSELADLFGVSTTAFSALENGNTQPTTEWSALYGAWLRKQRDMAEGSTFTEALAGEIRAKMGRRNLTVSSLAESTNIPNSTLARKVNGQTPFTTVELETIAGVLNTSIQALVLSVRVTA